LIEQGKSRIQELLPIRYGRMRTDPFAFLRAAAAVMASDLASTPTANIRMQACGDAHLNNFGSYTTADGLPVFDINDFDETWPAPFEWDLKRLVTSLVVAGRVAQYSSKAARGLASGAARSYREHIAALARLPPVESWNRHVDFARAIAHIDEPKVRAAPSFEHRRVLLHSYTLRDVASKAVGVGSVGTFCAIGLLTAGDGSPLLLQIKEAQESVLAPFVGAPKYPNHGGGSLLTNV
jgi:uncharacterized protein (DUF2252 family)